MPQHYLAYKQWKDIAPLCQALAIDAMVPLLSTTNSSQQQDPCPRKRLEIIWSCLATTIAASWVSVHPNIPHPHDSRLKRILRRIELMFWAIITPELIIFWAMRQWYGARKLERLFDALRSNQEHRRGELENGTDLRSAPPATQSLSFKWTRTHGFFLQMGGFMLHDKGRAKQVLGWETLMHYYKAGRIDLSSATEASINDHSKADGLAKGLALLQTFWFIVQYIARFSDKSLVLTELELASAALAVLSLIMYLLWWNKPFNAQIPIPITLLPKPRVDGRSLEESIPGLEPYTAVGGYRYQPCSALTITSQAEQKPLLTELKEAFMSCRHILKRIVEIQTNGFFESPDEEHIDNQSIPRPLSVPTFYSVKSGSLFTTVKMSWASFSAATLFGAIHCAGWSDKIVFHSPATSFPWRISSVIITCSPLVWSTFCAFGYAYHESEDDSFLQKLCDILMTGSVLMTLFTIPLYILSRLTVIVIAFVELQHLSPQALATISWANILPFIH